MKYLRSPVRLITSFMIAFALTGNVHSARVKVAVASNFTAPMKEIAKAFNQSTGHQALISFGSTGKLYAQIHHGAPFEVFLAADQERPELLFKQGYSNQPDTYAIGKLALWSSNPELLKQGSDILSGDAFKRIAIANPKTAPYGVGAIQILEKLQLANKLKPKLVMGENIAQTYQFVITGNAQLGFVAISQVAKSDKDHYWAPPQDMYDPLKQDVVLLKKGQSNPVADEFLAFLASDEAKAIIHRYGYATE